MAGIIIFVLQMRKLRLKEMREFLPSHFARHPSQSVYWVLIDGCEPGGRVLKSIILQAYAVIWWSLM
jgi:hypothetical protein